MNRVVDYLEQLDLSEIEAKLYLSLLKTGPISVRELAKATGIKRTTTYMYVDQLLERGLVMKLVKGARKLVGAIAPNDSLQRLVDEKIQKVQNIQNDFSGMLKEINTSLPDVNHNEDAEIKYLKGISAVKRIYNEAFSGKEFRSYVKVEEAPVLSSDNPGFFAEAFKKNKNLKVWEIMYDSPASRRQAFKTLSQQVNYFYKFMPPELKWSITSEDILIYDGKVAIINYKGNVSCAVLHSADFYNNSKELFDFIWRILPEPTN
jgi:predicted transcriptional regulator